MKRRAIVGILALLGLAIAVWWWATRAPRWNIVLITLDTTRADHLGCYGSETAITPNLDRLSADSILFERAYTVAPITLPAHATILTGLLPPEHGLRINSASRLPDAVPTLAEALGERGYRTGAFVSSLVLAAQFGLHRGFEVYDDALDSAFHGPRAERPAGETISSAVTWLNEAAGDPLFCWVHLYDPHEPYDAHSDEFGDQFAGAPYRGEIAYMDQQIGRLLKVVSQLGIDERTIIVVAGDHGEGLGEHQESTHGYLTYNSTLHVPLLIRHPSVTGGARVQEPVSLVDVFPTILDALQTAPAAERQGRSLLPCVRGQSLTARPCYAESEAPYMEGGWSPVRAWITDRWKYIETARPELYDLQADPHETANLIESHGDETARLAQDLADFEGALILHKAAAVASSEEQLRALRGLGYAGGQAPARPSAGPLRDIKDMLPYAEQVHQCMHLVDEGDVPSAQRILEGVVAAVPDYPKAWGTLGICLSVQREFSRAEECYRKALELDAHQNFARIGLGRALFETGRWEECVEELQSAVAVEPTALDAQFYLGEACLRLQRWDAARAALTAVIELRPEFGEGQRAMADLERLTGDLQRAADFYDRALELNPSSSAVALDYARVLSDLGRDGQAIETLKGVLQTSPQNVEAMCDLAQRLATTGNGVLRDLSAAVALAERACQLSNRESVRPLRVLAVAQAAAGRFQSATDTAHEALLLAKEAGDDRESAEIEAEIEDYRARAATRGGE